MASDQDFLREAADMGNERVANYQLFQDYYDGQHRTQVIDRAKEYLEASGIRFAENFCETVVDIPAERLSVIGFEAGDNESLSEHVDDAWQRNRMDLTQDTIHTQAGIKGDAFVIVDLNAAGRARYTWNRSDKVKCVYSDDTDEMEYAVKVWNTSATSFVNPNGDRIQRMNIYWPDRVERYFTLANDDGGDPHWQRFTQMDADTNLPQGWPLPWVDAAGAPLGIPVIHFKNRPKGSRYGRSDLAGVIPQQDQLNKQILDLFYVMDAQGWPQRYATGVDANSNLQVNPGEYLTAKSDSAKFGQFDAADPRPIIESIEATLRRIAGRSRVPLFALLPGQAMPSGEALKTAESPTVKLVTTKQVNFGNGHEDMVSMGVRLELAFSNPAITFDPDEDVIETQWENPASRDELQERQVFEIESRLGVSQATIMRKLGYDPEEEAAAKQEEQGVQEEAMARAIDQGRTPGYDVTSP